MYTIFNLILFLYHEDYIQTEATIVALLNIDKYNNIMHNTKEYKLIKRKDKTIYYKTRQISLSLKGDHYI
jgi:hypothetical protein